MSYCYLMTVLFWSSALILCISEYQNRFNYNIDSSQLHFQKQRGNKGKKRKTAEWDFVSYNVDDTVVAKMKISSSWDAAWPARIEARKDKGYDVFFFEYGTRSLIKPANIRPFQVISLRSSCVLQLSLFPLIIRGASSYDPLTVQELSNYCLRFILSCYHYALPHLSSVL